MAMATKEIAADINAALIRLTLDLQSGGQFIAPAGAMAELLGVVGRRWERWTDDGTTLVVRDIRQGSLIIELGVAMTGGVMLLTAAGHLNTLFDFAKNLQETFGRLKGWRRGEPLPTADYEVGRAVTALTKAGLTVTLTAALPSHGSVYARVSPESVEPLASHIDTLEGPPPVELPTGPVERRNVRLYVLQDGDGYRAFAPSIDPRPLPFMGLLKDFQEAERNDTPKRGDLLSSDLASVPMLRSYWDMMSVLDSDQGKRTYSTDELLRQRSSLGAGFIVDIQVVPGPTGPVEYIVTDVKHRLDE